MSLTVEEKNERENRLFPPRLMHFVSNTLCSCLQHTHFSIQDVVRCDEYFLQTDSQSNYTTGVTI